MKIKVKNTIKNIILITLPVFIVIFIILEIIFRTLIPASSSPRGFFNEEEGIFHLSTDPKTGVRTIGRFAEIRVRWHVNNEGWNYPVDYDRERKEGTKLAVVIGDSFIEALQVDVDRNYPYLLRGMLMPEYDVYAFGRGGASFAQYLHMSRYIARNFDPDVVIFNICYNDFDESILEVKPTQSYFMQLSISDDGAVREILPVADYSHYQHRPIVRFVFENSATARYLFGNLRIKAVRRNMFARRGDFEGNIVIDRVNAEKDRVIRAVEYIIERIMEENLLI